MHRLPPSPPSQCAHPPAPATSTPSTMDVVVPSPPSAPAPPPVVMPQRAGAAKRLHVDLPLVGEALPAGGGGRGRKEGKSKRIGARARICARACLRMCEVPVSDFLGCRSCNMRFRYERCCCCQQGLKGSGGQRTHSQATWPLTHGSARNSAGTSTAQWLPVARPQPTLHPSSAAQPRHQYHMRSLGKALPHRPHYKIARPPQLAGVCAWQAR